MQLPSSQPRCLQSDSMRCQTALAEEMYSTVNVASCSAHLQSLSGRVTSSNVALVTNLERVCSRQPAPLRKWVNGGLQPCRPARPAGRQEPSLFSNKSSNSLPLLSAQIYVGTSTNTLSMMAMEILVY